ncbi:MAG: diguanylate cyclase [Bacillota bacterium]|nr:diguanylate cyclase [Bacillota bacterium]
MRNSSAKSIKDIYELIEMDVFSLYADYKSLITEVGTIEDADKNFITAKYHMMNSEHAVALEYIELAETVYIAFEDKEALAFLYSQAAHCARRCGDGAMAEAYTEKSIAISEELGDAYCLINAYIYGTSNAMFLDEYDKALMYLGLTETLLEKHGSQLHYGHYYHNVAFAGYFSGDYDRLIENCDKAYRAYKEYYGNEKSRNVLIAANNKAEGYLMKGDYKSAIEILNHVIEACDEENYTHLLMDTFRTRADLYHRLEQYELAYNSYKRFIKVYFEWIQERQRNPEDENIDLKRKLEIAQDMEVVKISELIEKRAFLEQLFSTQKFVQKAGSQLISATNIPEIFKTVCDSAQELLMYDTISLGFVEGDEFVVRYTDTGNGNTVKLPFRIPISSREHVSTTCIHTGRDIKLNTFEEYLDLIQPGNVDEIIRNREHLNESSMFIRLIHEGKIHGLIMVQKKEPYAYSNEEFEAIQAVGSFISIAINNAFKTQVIEDKVKQLEMITLRDELTWLENRRAYNLYVDELVARDEEYMLIFADMNHLKQINDGLGHNNGDRYLTSVAEIINKCVRDYRKFRLSGDEFAIVIPNPGIEYTYRLVEQNKGECAKIEIGDYPLALAIGCGMRNKGENPDKVFSMAEARMYLDKHDYHKSMMKEMKTQSGMPAGKQSGN